MLGRLASRSSRISRLQSLGGSRQAELPNSSNPEGSRTQHLRIPVSNTILLMVFFGPESLNIGYLDPRGMYTTPKQTWNLKRGLFRRTVVCQGALVRFHVYLAECRPFFGIVMDFGVRIFSGEPKAMTTLKGRGRHYLLQGLKPGPSLYIPLCMDM